MFSSWEEKKALLRLNAEAEARRGWAKLRAYYQRHPPLHSNHYNPNQPRVLAGHPDGGQWTKAVRGVAGAQAIHPGAAWPVRLGGLYGLAGTPNHPPPAIPDFALIPVAASDEPENYRVDLLEEEARGGHTVARHVGKSFDSLARRLREYAAWALPAGIDFAMMMGSFPSLEAANKLVNSTIAQNRDKVDAFLRSRERRAELTAWFRSETGYEAYLPTLRGQPHPRDTYGVYVVIERDRASRTGFRVVTAFPIH